MPYVKQDVRDELVWDIGNGNIGVGTSVIQKPGDLNYALTMVIMRYFWENGMDYQAINDILGALEGAKQEFYRRMAVSYEEEKIKENGDVY